MYLKCIIFNIPQTKLMYQVRQRKWEVETDVVEVGEYDSGWAEFHNLIT